MVKEAAKAELITNAVNAEVPGYYIQAMITGKKPDFLNTLDAEEEKTGFRTEYEQITGAAVSIFETMTKERSIEENQKEREKAESEGTQHDADGSSTEDKRTE